MAVTPEQIEAIAGLVSVVLPQTVALVQQVITMIKGSDLPEATKEELIKRIRDAQASVPEWK